MSEDDTDYDIPGFWYIQSERLDIDCDGTYPLEPVVVLAEHLDDAINQADSLIVVPAECNATGRLIERRATMAEIREWLEAHDAEIRAEQIETDAEIAGDIEYIRDWDGYTPDDASHNTRLRAAEAIRAQLTPRPPAPELIPGVQAAVDALSIYRKG